MLRFIVDIFLNICTLFFEITTSLFLAANLLFIYFTFICFAAVDCPAPDKRDPVLLVTGTNICVINGAIAHSLLHILYISYF